MPSNTRVSRGKAALATLAGGGLVASTLALAGAAPAQAADPVDIQIIGTNDFHGRLLRDPSDPTRASTIPGAAEYAGAVEALRAENPNTIFAAAGDLIGATTFESFINQDKPTIDVLNAMDLDVSAVGNHELDQGYDDLVDRVMAPESESNPKGGAMWEYIAANLEEPGGADEIAESWTTDVAGVTVGFVGAVTEDLPSLVSPAGIEGLTVTDIVDATNAEADRLVADEGADLVVMLVHEGSPSTDCATMTDPTTTWGHIVTGVNANVDAIVSGHTHLAYDCDLPVVGGATRPVVSAGQYGSFLDKLNFSVDPTTGEVLGVTHELINVNTETFEPDAEVQQIVDEAVAAAAGPGSVPLGQIAAPFKRPAPLAGSTENNRGGESTLGNLVAEVQRWATRAANRGGAQIGIMNPGGLRADMVDTDGDGFPETLTYAEAAGVQPFANTLVNMRMTGDQIKTLLEQQWQRDGSGNVPTRPFLRLGTSKGFEYTYDPTRAEGDRITGIYLKGEEIVPEETYSVTANSFLASGGDNFHVFKDATAKRDTGVSDLQAMVDYMAVFTADEALAPSYAQHSVGLHLPDGKKVARGETLTMELSSLVMTAEGDLQDAVVRAKLGKSFRGKAPVDATLMTVPFDEAGTATLVVKIPKGAETGQRVVFVTGEETGTRIAVPIRITKSN